MRSRLRARLTPEGRWALVPWGQPDMASRALFATGLFMIGNRHEALFLERLHDRQCTIGYAVLEVSWIETVNDNHHGGAFWRGIGPSIYFDGGARNTGRRN